MFSFGIFIKIFLANISFGALETNFVRIFKMTAPILRNLLPSASSQLVYLKIVIPELNLDYNFRLGTYCQTILCIHFWT